MKSRLKGPKTFMVAFRAVLRAKLLIILLLNRIEPSISQHIVTEMGQQSLALKKTAIG